MPVWRNGKFRKNGIRTSWFKECNNVTNDHILTRYASRAGSIFCWASGWEVCSCLLLATDNQARVFNWLTSITCNPFQVELPSRWIRYHSKSRAWAGELFSHPGDPGSCLSLPGTEMDQLYYMYVLFIWIMCTLPFPCWNKRPRQITENITEQFNKQ